MKKHTWTTIVRMTVFLDGVPIHGFEHAWLDDAPPAHEQCRSLPILPVHEQHVSGRIVAEPAPEPEPERPERCKPRLDEFGE